jgi:hypothetical protein
MTQIILEICSRAHSNEHLASIKCEEFLIISLKSLRQEIMNAYKAFKRKEYVNTNIPLKILVENRILDIQTEKMV